MEETWHRRCLFGDWSELRFEANGGRERCKWQRKREEGNREMFQVHRYVFIVIIVAVVGEERIFDERG